MKYFLIAISVGSCFFNLSVFSRQAQAGSFEASAGFSFNRSRYSDDSYSWSRRWGSSLGYHFSDRTELEVAFQDIVDRTKIVGFEDTTFHDTIFSVNWVQGLVGKDWAVQPYVKVGVGQLNREATGSYANGVSPPTIVDSLTGILGAGARIYITRTFAIRTEVSSYLEGGKIKTWQQNIGVTAGLSYYF